MAQVFQGRSFLAEKDFSREEFEYLIDFSAHLKDLKNVVFLITILKVKILLSYLKKHLLVLAQPLQLQQLT